MKKKITVNNQIIDWQKNMTVEKILKKMNYTFKMIIVRVNGELVKKEDYGKKIFPNNANVMVIHLLAGG